MNNEKNKRKTLILLEKDSTNLYLFDYWKKNGYNASTIFTRKNKIQRAVRRFMMNYLPASLIPYYLAGWKKNINKYSTVIIFCSKLTKKIPTYIHSKNPETRIIYWYWNTVDKSSFYSVPNSENTEIWTFDDTESEKFNFKKNIQFYFKQVNNDNKKNMYDIYFIGRNKGRAKEISSFEKKAKALGLSCKIYVLSENEPAIPYSEVQKEIACSKAILEINKENQTGLTLRALESLFFSKKLITNNKSIVKSDFYNKQNIFILEQDELKKLKEFVESPYECSVEKYKEKYDVDAWFNNFFN